MSMIHPPEYSPITGTAGSEIADSQEDLHKKKPVKSGNCETIDENSIIGTGCNQIDNASQLPVWITLRRRLLC